ncbi:MAG: hypothetical protein A2Y95_00345 [Deltaproteobacteria bacterium RBG_13_65_10]|nr:MAG: hypothetical protein A2Y95_00345 [Deltaproteobacteria bacterium RBG_13_65_10]
MSDDPKPVRSADAPGVREDRACARCGSKEELLRYVHHEDHYYCRACWERVELQQRMIDEELEDEPSLE